jgi:hypothetical protein
VGFFVPASMRAFLCPQRTRLWKTPMSKLFKFAKRWIPLLVSVSTFIKTVIDIFDKFNK